MSRVWAAIVCFALLSPTASAQVTTGTISGVVRDTTGGVLPGATVTMKHVQTGMVRPVVSDHNGAYRAANLGLGAYEVEAALAGFQTEIRSGITLTIGRAAVVDFALSVGDVSERIEVRSEAPLVDTTSSSVAGLISEQAIRDLPLSGRDFVQLALLEPSVLRVTNTDNNVVKGFGTRTTFAGSRPRQNVFLMDGTNINNFTNFSIPGSVAGVVLGVDTVREFQVLVGSYSAEYAGAGGTLSAVTKSGTNAYHGTGFWTPITSPGLAVVDLSLVKHVTVAEGRRLELRAEGFNILNRANFGRPQALVFDRQGRVGTAGRITDTSTPARQIQLGLKFVF